MKTPASFLSISILISLGWMKAAAANDVAAANKVIVEAVFNALGSEDLDTLNRTFDPDGVTIFGREERRRGGPFATFAEAAPFPAALENVVVTVESMIAEGDEVAVRSTICGDHKAPLLGFAPTGKQVCARYLNLYRLEDGVIVSNAVGVHRDQVRAELEANAAE